MRNFIYLAIFFLAMNSYAGSSSGGDPIGFAFVTAGYEAAPSIPEAAQRIYLATLKTAKLQVEDVNSVLPSDPQHPLPTNVADFSLPGEFDRILGQVSILSQDKNKIFLRSDADRFLSALLANPHFRDFLSKKGVSSTGLTQKDMLKALSARQYLGLTTPNLVEADNTFFKVLLDHTSQK